MVIVTCGSKGGASSNDCRGYYSPFEPLYTTTRTLNYGVSYCLSCVFNEMKVIMIEYTIILVDEYYYVLSH